jgi:penicillin-binding protein 2
MNESVRERENERLVIIAVAFLAVFIIILLRLVNLQIIHGKEMEEESRNKLLRTREIIAPRGNIVDRNQMPITVNKMGYAIRIARTKMKEPERNEMILKLIKILEGNGESYENNLANYLTFNPLGYGSNINKSEQALNKWKREMVPDEKDVELLKTPGDTLKYFREKKFYIDEKYTDEEAYKIITVKYDMLIKGYTEVDLLLFAKNVSSETVAQLEERHQEFPGVTIDVVPQRQYTGAENCGHILGYIRGISPEEYQEKKDKGYKITDLIGKIGVEKTQEEYLRGTNGSRWVEVDTSGRVMGEVGSKPAIPGNDVILTIDSRLQKAAMESLEKNIELIKARADNRLNFGDANAGAAVAIDVNSGEILALASYPSYDPSIYLAGPEDKKAQEAIISLTKDEVNRPLVHRAIQGIYAPGSTFKPLTAIAGLEEGAITEKTAIYDTGVYRIDGMDFRCHGGPHYSTNLIKAMETSCNFFFNEVAYRIGIDNLDKWSKLFGLGEYTGVELSAEGKGWRANRETKRILQKQDNAWVPADTVQAGMGQSFNAYTPLQLANYVATLANGGTRFKPHIVKKIVNYDGSTVMETDIEYEKLPSDAENIALVRRSMEKVTNEQDGTAYAVFKDFPFRVAGKTGTPETGMEKHGSSSHGLFIAYAPADNPKIAVAVVIEHGVWGSNVAPVAKDILKEYFGLDSGSMPQDSIVPDAVRFTR